jgi:hypothetical protein
MPPCTGVSVCNDDGRSAVVLPRNHSVVSSIVLAISTEMFTSKCQIGCFGFSSRALCLYLAVEQTLMQ